MFPFNLPTALEKLAGLSLSWEPQLCSRVRFPRSRCENCLRGCPEAALSWDKALKLDEARCTSCGLCISLCPNGVFWSRHGGDSALAEEIAVLVSDNGGSIVIFGCAHSGQADRNIIALPCLGRLTENLLLAPFALGVTRVEVWRPECKGCAQERILSHLETVLLLGRKLATMVGRREDCIQVVRRGQYSKALPSRSRRLSRRDLFRQLGDEARQTMAAFLPKFENSKPVSPWVHLIGPKRAYLLKLVREFPQHKSTCMERKGLPLAEIEIGAGCVGCTVCATLCPTGALEQIENPDGVDIYFRPEICTGCQICQEACRFQAISFCANFDLVKLALRERRQLVHLVRKECRECAGEFLGVNEELCPACRQQRGEAVFFPARRP